jgi:putative proteasome-type protease
MTYCLGFNLSAGLVLASDSRTNAGIDYVTSFSKLHCFQPAEDRIFLLLSAGNLATTQEVVNRIRRDLDRAQRGEPGPSLLSPTYLFEAAEYVGRVSQSVQNEHRQPLSQSGVSVETTLILGGQIADQPHGLYLIYPQGNYIAASAETPYLQIGENKYGKPALDRIARPGLRLEDAARLALVSLEATSRSNLTVGPPYELAIYPAGALALSRRLKFDADDPTLKAITNSWNRGIQDAFQRLPRFDWEHQGDPTPLTEGLEDSRA